MNGGNDKTEVEVLFENIGGILGWGSGIFSPWFVAYLMGWGVLLLPLGAISGYVAARLIRTKILGWS